MIGYGHGNRAAALLDVNPMSAFPVEAQVNSVGLTVVEYDNGDYDGDIEVG